MLVHRRSDETRTDLAAGCGIGTTTVFRCIRDALDVLAVLAHPLHEAITVAAVKAFVVLDGTLLAIDVSRWCEIVTGTIALASTST